MRDAIIYSFIPFGRQAAIASGAMQNGKTGDQLITWQYLLNGSSRLTNYIQHWSPKAATVEFVFVWSRVLRISDLKRWNFLPSLACRAGKSSLARAAGKSPLRLNSKTLNGLKIAGVGIAVFANSFNTIAYQDMQSLAFGESRWLMHIPPAPGQSTAAAANGVLDKRATGSVVSAGLGRSLDFDRLTTNLFEKPKPQKINRALKGDRVVSSTIQRPPAHFSAGSVLRRHSLLAPLNMNEKQSHAFVKPKSATEAFKVASLFHVKNADRKAKAAKLPVMVASLVEESESSILSYSQEPVVELSPFAAVLRSPDPEQSIPKLNNGDHLWADDPLPKASFSKKQQMCLANGIYFESRGEPARGQAAVAQVILNRVRNPAYPNSICGVVYQNKHWRNRCQFSFACDRKRDRVSNPRLWNLAQQIASETTAGRIWLSQVGSSTHYHATYVRPKWARSMKKVGKIGLHIFYRTKGGGWS